MSDRVAGRRLHRTGGGVRVFPGGHLYVQPARERVAAAVAADVVAVLSEFEGAHS
jgi:surfactin synthase thioesterase subunit